MKKSTYAEEVLESCHVEHLSCLLAFVAKDALFRTYHLENSLMNFKHFGWARISDWSFFNICQFDVLIHFDFWVRHKSSEGHRGPLWVHFSYSLLNLEFNFDWLVFSQPDDGYSNSLFLVYFRNIIHRLNRSYIFVFALHWLEDWSDMEGSHLHDSVLSVLGFEDEVNFANLAIFNWFLRASASPRVLVVVNTVGSKRDESYSLAEELVVEDGGVLVDEDEMRCESGDFWDHDSPESVG